MSIKHGVCKFTLRACLDADGIVCRTLKAPAVAFPFTSPNASTFSHTIMREHLSDTLIQLQ